MFESVCICKKERFGRRLLGVALVRGMATERVRTLSYNVPMSNS